MGSGSAAKAATPPNKRPTPPPSTMGATILYVRLAHKSTSCPDLAASAPAGGGAPSGPDHRADPVADANAGLAKAVRHHLPEVPLQRCTVYLLRNVLTKAPQRLRARLAREVSNVFDAASKAEAQKRVDVLKAGLGKQVPEAMKCLDEGFAAATQFYTFPREHWHRIRSTNGLERLHGEIKRRTRAVGAFPDRASALRLVTAVALQVTAIWSDRSYLDMSRLATVGEAKATAA